MDASNSERNSSGRQEKETWSDLDGLTIGFRERMSGYLGVGESDPPKGVVRGRSENTPISFDVQIRIVNLGRFLRSYEHEAELTGTVTFAPLGGTHPIRDGRFNLFSVDPKTGMRQMVYKFSFTADDGETYTLHGHKEIYDDPGKLDLFEDMTRLLTTIYLGEIEQEHVYGAGELYFKLKDSPRLLAAMKVDGTKSLLKKTAALTAFASFAYGALREVYLRGINLFYDTSYRNLVLAGKLKDDDGQEAPFFLVSGIHDKGFPWGDDELFSDVLLAIGDGRGNYQRFCVTDRILVGLKEYIPGGIYHYNGPLFALGDGYSASFSQMQKKAPHLSRCQAELEVRFKSLPTETVPYPFPLVPKLVRRMSSTMGKTLRNALPSEQPLGIHITPYQLSVRSGFIRIRQPEGETEKVWKVISGQTVGEAELGTFRNVREPTLLYSYLCALKVEKPSTRIQILTRTLRDEREHWAKDQLDAFLGTVVSRMSSAEVLIKGGKLSIRPLPPAGKPEEQAKPLRKIGEPVMEVNNDHFPTAVFQRRIVEVEDEEGDRCLALEEDMSLMRLEAIDSDRKAVVASIKEEDKFRALDRVLDDTGFDNLVAEKLVKSGKERSNFSVAIKPNFMFAYDRRDRTTYTDPELVEHLVRRLRALKFESIYVVEAQSTYGEYFDKRSVREVAGYLGYDERAGYRIIDMTEDADEKRHLGSSLGYHPVSKVWRDADFRISFAKNKTHAYAYYTLTLKNIYGALPLANKFKEYHCDRDIYNTTIEYLSAFPVDYGLVDGYLSADGPFGIFADPTPNETQTVIGGSDLVAVDWIAASKMGIDPMISPYMRLAVKAFGKPEIQLIGDANPYRPWLNVPVALTLFTHKGLDADHYFGNLIYTSAAQMDETHFRHKSSAWHVRLLRRLTVPIRRLFFLRTGENPTLGRRMVSRLLYRLGF